ncbi:MAG: IS1 family transposase [Parcubacteria group bacterium]|nr:IS1 family transposase [Parcubacteria group bacterium]
MPTPKNVPGKHGYCPRCGSDDLFHGGQTTNYTKKARYKCKGCGYQTTSPLAEKPKSKVKMRTSLPRKEVYIFTAAQNATPIHKPFWANLLQLKKYRKADLEVLPGRYKNPTSQWTQGNDDHEWWADEVKDYLFSARRKITERLVVLGDLKIEWASNNPLLGMDAFTKNMCGVVGHGKRELNSIATPQHKHSKIMVTTGACTIPNYTDTKRGKLGEFNHCLGAIIIEVDEGAFYIREINADAHGNFIDLDMEFTPEGVLPAKRALSLTMGDTHHRFMSPHVTEATFTGKANMLEVLKPRYLFWHDLLDFHSRNHHHHDDWFTKFAKWKEGRENVRAEVEEALDFVAKMTSCSTKSIIVSSNHDRAMLRWLKEGNFKDDLVNAEFYLDLTKMVMRTARMTEKGAEYDDPFILYGKKYLSKKNVRFLRQNESFVLAGVEHGFHGDLGPNNARGTTRNLSKIGAKVTKGHSHTAQIVGGCYSTGSSTGPLEYEKGGPSSHSNAHVVEYANGKRSLLFIINGRYCLKNRVRKTQKSPANATPR